MARVLGWVGIALAAVLVLALAIGVAARFSDGPIGPFQGGPLVAGELVAGEEIDWSFARGMAQLELQLLEPPRSRTTWFVLHEGALYVPCGVPRFRLWKQWPHQAMRDGRAVLRIDGRRYAVQAVRVHDPELHATLARQTSQKYGVPEGGPDDAWFFRMEPRPTG